MNGLNSVSQQRIDLEFETDSFNRAPSCATRVKDAVVSSGHYLSETRIVQGAKFCLMALPYILGCEDKREYQKDPDSGKVSEDKQEDFKQRFSAINTLVLPQEPKKQQ